MKKIKNERYYKYKSINTILDLERLFEIFEDMQIYLPRYNQLNDIFESHARDIYVCTAGSSMSRSLFQRNGVVDNLFLEYGILSLTKDAKNSMMWAMYANQFCGVCICFEGLKKVKKMNYLTVDEIKKLSPISGEKINKKIIKEILLIKHKKWEHENEWRIIIDNDYYKLKKKNIPFIILGHKLNQKISKIIYLYCQSKKIKVYKTYVAPLNNEVKIVDYNYVPQYDGSDFDDSKEIKI